MVRIYLCDTLLPAFAERDAVKVNVKVVVYEAGRRALLRRLLRLS